MRMVSLRIMNLCVRSVHAFITYACTGYTRKELMCAVSVLISFFHFSNVHFVYPQHPHKELMRMLIISLKIRKLKRSLQHMLNIRLRN
jgi:hypothetical protein